MRDRFCILGEGPDRAIRTPAWMLRTAAASELYAKPDDRWEVNDVAGRCRDIVDKLVDVFPQYAQLIKTDSTADLPPLEDVLLNGFE